MLRATGLVLLSSLVLVSNAFAFKFVVSNDASKIYTINGAAFSVVDTQTGNTTKLQTVDLGGYDDIAISPDGKEVYVASETRSDGPGVFEGSVDIFSTVNNTQLKHFGLNDDSEELVLSVIGNSDNYRVLVSYITYVPGGAHPSRVRMIDGKTESMTQLQIPQNSFEQNFYQMVSSRDGHKGYAATRIREKSNSSDEESISIFDFQNDQPSFDIGAYKLPFTTYNLAINPLTSDIYISTSFNAVRQIHKLNLATKQTKLFMYTGTIPNLVFVTNPDTSKTELYMNGKGNAAAPVNDEDKSIITVIQDENAAPIYIKLTHFAEVIKASQDGRKVFAGDAGSMSIIDTKTHQVISTFHPKS